VDRSQHFARRFRYVLTADIRKFFPSLDHQVLKDLVVRKIKDPDVLWLVNLIIDHSNPQGEVPGDAAIACPSQNSQARFPQGLPCGACMCKVHVVTKVRLSIASVIADAFQQLVNLFAAGECRLSAGA